MKKLEDILENYYDHLLFEKGLSELTLESYSNDLNRYVKYLSSKNIQVPDKIKATDIRHFVTELRDIGLNINSIIRNLSSIKNFHKYIVNEDYSLDNPSLHIETPKHPKTLPEVMSVEDIEKLFKLPDLETPLGLRDRAMMEMMYACGLRISELLTIAYNSVIFEDNIVRVIGKRNKERIVPIGTSALDFLQRYLDSGSCLE